MWSNDRPRLPKWIREAYDLLEPHLRDGKQEVTRERAIELLLEDEQFEHSEADARFALKRLLERGWLYETHDDLRVTDPEHD